MWPDTYVAKPGHVYNFKDVQGWRDIYQGQQLTLRSSSLLPEVVDGGSVKDTLATVVVEAVMVAVRGKSFLQHSCCTGQRMTTDRTLVAPVPHDKDVRRLSLSKSYWGLSRVARDTADAHTNKKDLGRVYACQPTCCAAADDANSCHNHG